MLAIQMSITERHWSTICCATRGIIWYLVLEWS